MNKLPFLICILLFPFEVFADGVPLYQNFLPKDYLGHAQNWSIAQDSKGTMYFANSDGLRWYNGLRWDSYLIEELNYIKSIAISTNDIIYTGCKGEFGMLTADKKGKLHYNSLSSKLAEKDKSFNEIWSIFIDGGNVIFFSNDKIFTYSKKGLKVLDKLNEQGFHKMFFVNGKFIVRHRGIGLYEFDATTNKLKTIVGTSYFADKSVDFIFDNGDAYFIGTRTDGLFNYNKNSHKLSDVNLGNKKTFSESEIYHAIRTHENKFMVATRQKGIFYIDSLGTILEHIDGKKKLINDCVWYVFQDKQHNIWAATDIGISLINYFYPFRFFGDEIGLKGNVNASIYANGKMYVATTQKLYCLENNVIQDLYVGSAFNFCNFKVDENHTELLVSTAGGIQKIINEKIIYAEKEKSNFKYVKLLQSKNNKNLLYALGDNSLSVYQYSKGVFELIHYANINLVSGSLAEDTWGNLFIGIEAEGVYCINPSEFKTEDITNYLKKVGLKNRAIGGADCFYIVCNYNRVILVGTNKGIYQISYNPLNIEKAELKATNIFDNSFENTKYNVNCLYASGLNLWFNSVDNNEHICGYFKKNSNDKLVLFSNEFKTLNSYTANSFYVTPFKSCYISITGAGLTQYLFDKDDKNIKQFNCNINQILGSTNDTLFGDFYTYNQTKQGNNYATEFLFSNNSLKFIYSATTYIGKGEIKFKTFLEGFDKNYTQWSADYTRNFTNLQEGDYKFNVVAMDVFGNISNTSTYSFVILPPWYRTSIAYILYILLSILVVREIVKYNTKRLKAQNDLLEKIVTERTYEIAEQKTEIEKSNVELAQKNKDIEHQKKEITQSIEYAQHIQQSILPDKELIYEAFPQSFVLYKPKDIVSGDFYAFTQREQSLIIASADCTGHGVPGALMSMLGSNILYQIINEKNITTPADILYWLNLGVAESLKQNKNEGSDGMDIALCNFNLAENKVQYAGAYRPFYIVRNGELVETKATKIPIGGQQKNEERFYQNHEFELQKNDTIYLTSDGYADQFGGEKGKKLTTSKFKEMLISIQHLSMTEQEKFLSDFILNWRGFNEQVDDICIIGIRV